MANRYYAAGPDRAAKVDALFGRIASRYDLLNDLQSLGLHRLWKRRLARLARLRPGDRALDLCCGTGDVAAELARSGAAVIGLDFSAPMLAVARQRQAKTPRGVVFVQGDALHLAFADAQFDAVTISYGLRNLASLEGGLREMWRVAKPGGRLLALDFGQPPNAVWRWFYFQYLRLAVPLVGRVFHGDAAAYAYILESLRHYPGQTGVAEIMRALGGEGLRVINLLGGAMSINLALKPGTAY